MTVTDIQASRRTRLRGTGRTNPAAPGTADWYEEQAGKHPQWAEEYRAEAARLRAAETRAA